MIAVALAGFVVVLLRSSTPGCTVVVDHPALPASLTALGDFQQPYDAGSPSTLEDVAARAGSAEDTALIGTTPLAPVTVVGAGTHPTALVVPLQAATAGSGAASAPGIVGLVVFDEDCAGNAYFEVVENDAGVQPPLRSFPAVSRATAVASLGSADVVLAYTISPLHPVWELAGQPTATLAAR